MIFENHVPTRCIGKWNTKPESRMPLRLITAAALILAAPAAHAWERTIEYRFTGAEIVSFKVTEPAFDEEPTFVRIMLSDPMGGDGIIEFEDDSRFEDCAETLSMYKGDASTTIVLVVDTNATTMNGSVVVQCSTR